MPIIRFLPNNYIYIIQTIAHSYIAVVYDSNTKLFYKIPFSSPSMTRLKPYKLVYVCVSSLYSIILIYPRANLKFLKPHTDKKWRFYKPIYFERFKYVGKGFKLILKRRKKFFNCVFGHSHVYWLKFQKLITKRTKKYKYIFVAKSYYLFLKMVNLLKNVKPINRYTLRGVRTYVYPWIKRKGRKSIATHI